MANRNYKDLRYRGQSSNTVSSGSTFDTANIGVDLIPSDDSDGIVGQDLGSPTKKWRDLYLSAGSLYVDGQKVIESNNGTIQVQADPNQSLLTKTTGTGSLQLSSENGIQLMGEVNAGTGDINIGTNLDMNTNLVRDLGTPIADTDAATKGYVDSQVVGAMTAGNDVAANNLTVAGNLTVSGTTTTVNSEVISLADNIIDLNSNFTTGSPSENAGIKVKRGDSADVQIRWNETSDQWEYTNDGATYNAIGSGGSADLTGYATETYVDNAVSNVSTSPVNLDGYATETFVNNAVSAVSGSSALSAIVTAFVTDPLIDTTIAFPQTESRVFTHAADPNRFREVFIEKEVVGDTANEMFKSTSGVRYIRITGSRSTQNNYFFLTGVMINRNGSNVNLATANNTTILGDASNSNAGVAELVNGVNSQDYWVGWHTTSLTATENCGVLIDLGQEYSDLSYVSYNVWKETATSRYYYQVNVETSADGVTWHSNIFANTYVFNEITENLVTPLTDVGDHTLAESVLVTNAATVAQTSLVSSGDVTTALSFDNGVTYTAFSADHGTVSVPSGSTTMKVKANTSAGASFTNVAFDVTTSSSWLVENDSSWEIQYNSETQTTITNVNADAPRHRVRIISLTSEAGPAQNPTITAVSPSSYTGVDATPITITGTNFDVGTVVDFIDANGAVFRASSTAVVTQGELTAVTPQAFGSAQGPLDVKVTTGAGLFVRSNDVIQTGAAPVWTTVAGALSVEAFKKDAEVNVTLAATDPEGSIVVYEMSSGTLPPGLTLTGNTGVIGGTIDKTQINADTTFSFTIDAIDTSGNRTSRSFSIAVENALGGWDLPNGNIVKNSTMQQYGISGPTDVEQVTYAVYDESSPQGGGYFLAPDFFAGDNVMSNSFDGTKDYSNTAWTLAVHSIGTAGSTHSHASVHSAPETYQGSVSTGVYQGWYDLANVSQVVIWNYEHNEYAVFDLAGTVTGESLYDRAKALRYVTSTANPSVDAPSYNHAGIINTINAPTGALNDSNGQVAYFHLYGGNTSSDSDESVFAFTSQPGNSNNWGDSWRSENQLGTLWSMWNDDYFGEPGSGARNFPDGGFNMVSIPSSAPSHTTNKPNIMIFVR